MLLPFLPNINNYKVAKFFVKVVSFSYNGDVRVSFDNLDLTSVNISTIRFFHFIFFGIRQELLLQKILLIVFPKR